MVASLLSLMWPGAVGASSVRPSADFRFFRGLPKAHGFEMQTVDGTPLTLSDLKGKVVLLNFWRADCPHCVREKSHLRKMMGKLKDRDLTVVCVNLWDNPAWIRRYAKKNGEDLLFVTRSGQGESFVKNVVRGRFLGYHIINVLREAVYEVKGFPTTYVIDRQGRVVATHLGMARWNSPSVRTWIARLVGKGNRAGATSDRYRPPLWLDRLLTIDPARLPRRGIVSERRSPIGPTRWW